MKNFVKQIKLKLFCNLLSWHDWQIPTGTDGQPWVQVTFKRVMAYWTLPTDQLSKAPSCLYEPVYHYYCKDCGATNIVQSPAPALDLTSDALENDSLSKVTHLPN